MPVDPGWRGNGDATGFGRQVALPFRTCYLKSMAAHDRDIRFYEGTAPAYKKAFQQVVERAKSQIETDLKRVLWDGKGRVSPAQRTLKKKSAR